MFDIANNSLLLGLSNELEIIYVYYIFKELQLVFQFMLGKSRFILQATVLQYRMQLMYLRNMQFQLY